MTLLRRWPTALGLVTIVAGLLVLPRDAESFGPAVAAMGGVYLLAYAVGIPWFAWPGFVIITAVTVVAQIFRDTVDPAVTLAVVMLLLWLAAVVRRRWTDRRTFVVQTGGLVVFAVIAMMCSAVRPGLGLALAGVGWLAHGAWDAYHFARNSVVDRPWSEFCAVVDLGVGGALLIAALAP
ncbi:hypothetical protein [Actinoplanes sp. NPDC089786]|uniref:hypothetical protein n=1 Tax=Actinoplanes sp. NPDC089786 TaxID=3155185 RepID=UPI00342B8200